MKKLIFIAILSIILNGNKNVFAQESELNKFYQEIAKIRSELKSAPNDTIQVYRMYNLCNLYKFHKPDSAIYFGNRAAALAIKIDREDIVPSILAFMVLAHMNIGNDSQALQLTLDGLRIAERLDANWEKAHLHGHLGNLYRNSGYFAESLKSLRKSGSIFKSIRDTVFYSITKVDIANTFLSLNNLDSAQYYFEHADEISQPLPFIPWHQLAILNGMGRINAELGNYDLSLSYFRQSLNLSVTASDLFYQNFELAKVFNQTSQSDSSIYYCERALDIAEKSGIITNIIHGNNLLSEVYENLNLQKAFDYKKSAMAWTDSLRQLARKTALLSFIEYDQEERQYELEKTRTEYKNRLRRNAFLGSTFTLIIIAIFLFILIRRKQKAKQKIELAYDQLKSTQSQLIQSEKMASLGELTAGIAHEIQNPLNFVNNFSEVNSELIEELKSEKSKGKSERDEELEEEIFNDLQQNTEKINHHGKRADAIVKGMLQHSRTSSGVKELTDINALADEYLRLAYHGLRAKDKSFNADFKLEADENLPKINVVPQDIGRVLLNLINNAFYAAPLPPEGGFKDPNYIHKPMVIVKTSYLPPSGGMRGALISVSDNGPGIPSSIIDKIFQPFFTTKPTGQGTGLGLSLSYDIIKAHGGEITVDTEEGNGTRFIIRINSHQNKIV